MPFGGGALCASLSKPLERDRLREGVRQVIRRQKAQALTLTLFALAALSRGRGNHTEPRVPKGYVIYLSFPSYQFPYHRRRTQYQIHRDRP